MVRLKDLDGNARRKEGDGRREGGRRGWLTKVRLEREMEEGTGWLKLLPKERGREGGLLAVGSRQARVEERKFTCVLTLQ